MVNLSELWDISYSLPLVIYSRNPWLEWWIFVFAWRDIKRQTMSRDLLYYLSLKRYITVNHSGQNYLRNNETTATAIQSISVIWHLATPFWIYIHNRSRDLSYQHLKLKVSRRCYILYCGQFWLEGVFVHHCYGCFPILCKFALNHTLTYLSYPKITQELKFNLLIFNLITGKYGANGTQCEMVHLRQSKLKLKLKLTLW